MVAVVTLPSLSVVVITPDSTVVVPVSGIAGATGSMEVREVAAQRASIARSHSSLTFRYVYRYEMQHLLELCGFKVEALYGNFQRAPFRYGGEQIWVCQRA